MLLFLSSVACLLSVVLSAVVETQGLGYYFYAELAQPGQGHYAGGKKVYIAPGEAAEVTIIQVDTFLSVNVTKVGGDGDSYFDIYGANDGGLVDVVAGIAMTYESNQRNLCDDYASGAFVVSDIVAVEMDGT